MKQSVVVYAKRILVDANFLVALVSRKSSEDVQLRLKHFIATIEKQQCSLVVPMPALAEYLVGADSAGLESLNAFERKTFVQMANFDRAAAYECSILDGASLGRKDKKDGSDAAWQKIKVDRQIVAIGKAQGAGLVISQDRDVRTAALRVGMHCLKMEELELPPGAQQGRLDFSKEEAANAKAPVK